MSARLFNICLLVGWLFVLGGGCLVNPGYGLAFAGMLLLAMVCLVAKFAGVYLPKKSDEDAG